jgi:hypothetical protein
MPDQERPSECPRCGALDVDEFRPGCQMRSHPWHNILVVPAPSHPEPGERRKGELRGGQRIEDGEVYPEGGDTERWCRECGLKYAPGIPQSVWTGHVHGWIDADELRPIADAWTVANALGEDEAAQAILEHGRVTEQAVRHFLPSRVRELDPAVADALGERAGLHAEVDPPGEGFGETLAELVAPAPRGAEQERCTCEPVETPSGPVPDGRTRGCPMHDPEHGAEGDEEPRADCQPPGAEQLRPPDRTEEALRKRIAEADEQINRLHVTLTEARRERDAERERRIEMTRMGERGELSGWKERAEQAEAELAEARRAAKDLQDDVEREMWAKADFLARAETAERERDELAAEVERLREALERIAGLGDDQAVLDGEQTLGTAIGIARSALEDSDG